MNIESTVKKAYNSAISNADKLGLIYGVIQDPIAEGRGLEGAPDFMIDRLSKWHIPDPAKILEMIRFYPQYYNPLKTAIMAYLAGYGLDFIGQSKWAKAIKKAAIGIAEGVGVGALLWLPAINPHGAPSTAQNFNNAPTLSSYEY